MLGKKREGAEKTHLSVHRPRQQHPLLLLSRPPQPLTRPVLPVRKVLRSLKNDMLGSSVTLLSKDALSAWSNVVDDVRQVDAGEERRAESCRSPRETERLGDDVLLFTTVTGADEGDGKGDRLELGRVDEVGEGEGARTVDETGDVESPFRRFVEGDLRDDAVIADVEETGRREESGVPKVGEWRLRVERPFSGQTDEGCIANDPLIG